MREDISTRAADATDLPALKALWGSVFDDAPEDIDAYFDAYFAPELCAVANIDAELAAMGFLMPVGALRVPGERELPCAMIYAVATRPDFRGRGAGLAVTRALLETAKGQGFDVVALRPATEELFEFYEKAGLRTSFCGFDFAPERAEAALKASRKVTAGEYMARREALLRDIPHVAFDERALSYAETLFGEGGGFFVDGDDCLAVDASGGGAVFKEYLAADGVMPRGGRFGMSNAEMTDGYMGFAFD
ncbi:MAG: GNAT family N-acetyltransferase [Oscillospiraceae bacterium]|jgi:ribosomal protein S18 acetylase RimI-like enzyme|nr:GNAT family N-acetyltransferase [Oscillospiraceae bacterium]